MADFMRTLLAGLGDDDDTLGLEDAAVFEHALTTSRAISTALIEQANEYTDKGEGGKAFFKASLFLFIVAWSLVGHLYVGVSASLKKHGKSSMVAKLWHLMRIGYATDGSYSGDLARVVAKLETFEKDWERGKYDDVH